jgi:hypothetical protein
MDTRTLTGAALAAALLATLAAAAPVTAAPADHPEPRLQDRFTGPDFEECRTDSNGHITSCTQTREYTGLTGGFTASDAHFWVTVQDVELGGDTKAPHVAWLHHNGYATTDDTLADASRHDVNTSEPVRTALETHSTCILTADVASHGDYTVTTSLGDFTYSDEPDGSQLHAAGFMQRETSITADRIKITASAVYCRFDMAALLEKGMHPDGAFQSWTGRQPVIGEEAGASGDIALTFDDGGFRETRDARDTGANMTNATPVYVVGGTVSMDGGTVNMDGGIVSLGDDASVTVDQVGEKKEGESWFESAVSGIMDTVGGDGITAAILRAVTGIFLETTRVIWSELVKIITWTPDVDGNPAVENLHRLCLQIAFALAAVVIMAAGVLHMTGPILGISYADIRLIIPRLVLGLGFGAVSLPLLQYGVDAANILVEVLLPPELNIAGMLGVSVATLLVIIIQATVLVVVVVAFVIRGAYILFVAAISPVLAVMWALPRARRYSQTFIAGWFAALLMAPADILVLRLMMELFQNGGPDVVTAVSNWVYGLAAAVLLLWVPRQLYGASQAIVGHADRLTRRARYTVKRHGGLERAADAAGYTDEYRSAMSTLYGPRWEKRKAFRDHQFQEWQEFDRNRGRGASARSGGNRFTDGLHTIDGEEYDPPWRD